DPEAWVCIPSEAEVRAKQPHGKIGSYDFGFIPAMRRLLGTHVRIGSQFFNLHREIMFSPGQLSRREREMIAAIAAAAQDCHY
ncbi:MAG: carboxymuconolactone decarboxylase family protein, partial [Nitrospinota bacterium]